MRWQAKARGGAFFCAPTRGVSYGELMDVLERLRASGYGVSHAMLEHDRRRHLSPAFWSIAGILAVALHVGGVGLALVSTQPNDEPDLGAPAIEIGIELAAPKLEPTDLPVGPDAEAAAPSPAMVEQKAVIEHNDLPKATPTETDDPDRIVSPNETPKPKEEEPKEATRYRRKRQLHQSPPRQPLRRPSTRRRRRLFRLLLLWEQATVHVASEQRGKKHLRCI